jgi:hypothetical protein
MGSKCMTVTRILHKGKSESSCMMHPCEHSAFLSRQCNNTLTKVSLHCFSPCCLHTMNCITMKEHSWPRSVKQINIMGKSGDILWYCNSQPVALYWSFTYWSHEVNAAMVWGLCASFRHQAHDHASLLVLVVLVRHCFYWDYNTS